MRENEIYLDSWEAKSKALSASWNEFVNTFLNADMFKGFIGGVTEVIKWLTDVNAMLPIVAGLIGGLLASAILKGTFTLEGFNAALVKTNILSGGIPMLIGAIVTLIGVGISWGAAAFDTSKQIEKLNGKIKEQQTEIDKLTAKEKDVVDLYKEYNSLMSKSQAYGLNASEKETLLKISKELVETYGLETSGIDTLTGAYIVGTNAINDYVEALKDERIEKQREQTDARNKRIKKNIKSAKNNSAQYDIEQVKKDVNQYVKKNAQDEARENESKSTYGGTGMGVFANANKPRPPKIELPDYVKKIDNPVVKRLIKQTSLSPEDIRELENALARDNAKYNSIVNSIVKDLLTNIQVDNADMLDSNGESLLTQMLTPYLTTVDWDKFDQEDFEAKVKSFVEGASGAIAEVSAKLKDSQGKMMSGDMNFTGYTDMYGTLQNQAGLLKQMLDQGIINPDSYKQQTSQIYSQIANNIGLSMAEISGQIEDTDEKSKKNFQNVADNLIALENQFKKGSISSTEYISSLTQTIENMDFTEVFGENTEAAQQFFATLANKSANILQDTITQFKAGKMSVKDYGNNLKDFAKQQKELADNAIQEAKAMGMSEKEVKKLSKAYEESGEKIDKAVKQWEELEGINTYLDENIETLRTTTDVSSSSYQSFASGLYGEFTKLSDDMQSKIIADMQKMDGLGKITAENLQSEMAKSTAASAGLADAISARTNGVFKSLANNGGKVLTALGNAIKSFKYTITFNPNPNFSGGEFNLEKWAKSGGKEGIKLPSISWDITGKAGEGAAALGDTLSSLGSSLSVASDFLTTSDYGGKTGGGGGSSGGGGGSSGGGGGKGSGGGGGKDKSADDAKKKAEEEEKKRIEAYKESLNVRKDILDRYKAHMGALDFGLELFSEDDYEGQFDALSLKLNIATEYGKELKEAFEDAASTMPKTGEEVDALASHLSSLSSDIQSNVKEIREMTVALEKAKIGMIATRSEDYLGEMSKEISALEKRMEIAKSDNPDAYKYTEKALDLQMFMPSQSSINKKVREKSKEDREIVKMEQETQDKLDEILREQIEKNEKLRDDEKKKLLENMQELRDDTVTKLVEIEGRVGEACTTIETLVDSTDVEFPEPTINFSKATTQFNDFGSVVDRLDTKARNLAKDLGLLASTSGIKDPGVGPGKKLATGTPGGNAKAKDLGIAGENYKPEVLIDKATGKTTLIDKPTLIDITKTDVVGEKATAELSKFAKGTFKNKEDGFAALMNAKPYDRNLDFVGSAQRGYDESTFPDNTNYQAKYKEYEQKVSEWIDQFDKAGYPFDTIYPISSKFGKRFHPIDKVWKTHYGVDFNVPAGVTIRSVSSGIVISAGYAGGWGNRVVIQDAKGGTWLYAHMLQQPSVVAGQKVVKGQAIGLVGSTGKSTGPHLHLERTRPGVGNVDPLLDLEYYATGTPKGNAKAKDLGVAGENNKPEILVDKKSGEMQYIDSPTLIDTTKTDVIGEKETDGIPKFADGTVDPADIARYIREKYPEITDAGIAGILGNIKYESNFNPKAYNPDEKRSGLVQTDNTRISNWSNIVNSGTWQEQIDAVIYEGRYLNSGMGSNSAYNVWDKVLTNATLSASQAASEFDRLWERSSGAQRSDRSKAAEDYYKQLSTWLTTASSTPATEGATSEPAKEEEQRNPLIVELEEKVVKPFEEIAEKAHNEFTRSVFNTTLQSERGDIDTLTEQAQLYDAAKVYKDAVVPQAFQSFSETLRLLNEYTANGGNDPEVIEAYTEAIESQFDAMSNGEEEVESRRQDLIDLYDKDLSKIDDIIGDHDFYNDWSESEKSKVDYIDEKIVTNLDMLQKRYLTQAEYDARARELDQERYAAIDDEMQKAIDAIEKRATDGETYNKWADWGNRTDSKLKVIADELKVYTEYFKSGHLSPESFEEYRKGLADRAYTEGLGDLFGAIDKLISDKETAVNDEKEALNLKGSKLDSRKTLMQSHFNAINAISDERHEIEKSLAESRAMAEYLDENTRKLLFNDDDFEKLSSELNHVQKEAEKLERNYKKALNTATKETLPTITSQYQMQYETLMKSYEISKADLEIAKKKQKLNNVLNERNVRMFIDGRWQWVANTQSVISAQNELSEAEHGNLKASTSLSQQEELNAVQTKRDAITEQIAFLDTDLENIRRKWTEMQTAIEGENQSLYQILNDMVTSGIPELEYVVEHFGGAISKLYTDITGEELDLPKKYSNDEDYMLGILSSNSEEEVIENNALRNSKIKGSAPGEPGYGQTMYSDEEAIQLWRDEQARIKEEIYSRSYEPKAPSNPNFIPITAFYDYEKLKNPSSNLWSADGMGIYGQSSTPPSIVNTNNNTNNITNINIDGINIDGNSRDGKDFVDSLNRLTPIYS